MDERPQATGITPFRLPANWQLHYPALRRISEKKTWRHDILKQGFSDSQLREFLAYFTVQGEPYNPAKNQYGAVYIRIQDSQDRLYRLPPILIKRIFGHLINSPTQHHQTKQLYHPGKQCYIPVPTLPASITALSCHKKPQPPDVLHDPRFLDPTAAGSIFEFQQHHILRHMYERDQRANPHIVARRMSVHGKAKYDMLARAKHQYCGILMYEKDYAMFSNKQRIAGIKKMLNRIELRNQAHNDNVSPSIDRQLEDNGAAAENGKRARAEQHITIEEMAEQLGMPSKRVRNGWVASYIPYFIL